MTERRWNRNDGVLFRMIEGNAERHDDELGWTPSCFDMDNFENRDATSYYRFTEVFDHLEPTELPPTTADLHNELAAYKQFAAAIIASFGDDAKRNHQMDFQHAYDRLRAVVKEPMA